MTVETPPGIVNDVSTDSKIHRHAHQARAGHPVGSFAGGVSSFGTAHGICYPAALAVTQQGSPTMGVTVAAGTALVTGTVSAEQGPYSFYNDAPVNLSISAAHATQTRYDLVIAQIRDDDYSGADTDARLTVVTGTPSGAPADPSLASFPNALVLARVTVAGAATSITNANITDLRTPARASAWYQAWGKIAQAIRTTNQGSIAINTTTDLTGLSVTFNGVAGRLYRISGRALITLAGNAPFLVIRDGSSNHIDRLDQIPSATGTYSLKGWYEMEATGATTIKLGLTLNNAGSAATHAAATAYGFLTVEDIGPA